MPETDKEAFRDLGVRTLGSGWVYRLAAFAGVAVRTAQRWAAGTSPVPLGVLADLERQRELLAQTDYAREVYELSDRAVQAGLSPHVVSAVLRDVAGHFKPEPEDSPPKS